jgi:hypothetical protein
MGPGYQLSRRDMPLLLLAPIAAFFAGASMVLLVTPGPPSSDSPEAWFARDMTVHHAQAVEMAEIVRDKTESDDIRTLATDIGPYPAGPDRDYAGLARRLGTARLRDGACHELDGPSNRRPYAGHGHP